MNYGKALGALSASMRADSWMNFVTGLGTRRDPSTWSTFAPKAPITPIEVTSLYNWSPTARKIVSLAIRQMFREGYEIKTTAPDVSIFLAEEAKRVGLDFAVFEAAIWGRAYGGGLIWAGLCDGRAPNEPLGRPVRLDFLEVFDPRFAMPDGPSMLDPERWWVWGIEGGSANVHKSRTIRFRGVHTDELTRRGNRGWDLSILDALLDDIQAFDEAFHSGQIMLKDASQAVIKIKGLIAMLAGAKRADLATRASLMDMSRSVARALFLDTDEEFQKVPTVFSGVSDMLDRCALKLASATDIPVAVLMGQSPAGLQATGALDVRLWYDQIKSDRKKDLEPRMLKILRMLAIPTGYTGPIEIEWPSLWQESPSEQAATRKTIADADKIYEDMGGASPQLIIKSRWGKGKFNPDMIYDPADSPTWAAEPKNVTQDPIGGKPAAAPPGAAPPK